MKTALCSLEIGGMRDPESIGLLFDIAREGPGYRGDFELPADVSPEAVLEKRSQLSAAYEDRGLGILKGDGSEPIIYRTVAGVDSPTDKKVARPGTREPGEHRATDGRGGGRGNGT